MLSNIQKNLSRVGATNLKVSLDTVFEPDIGPLLKVENGSAYWHLLPITFQQILDELPDHAGSDAVHQAIETNALPVWHGTAPARSN